MDLENSHFWWELVEGHVPPPHPGGAMALHQYPSMVLVGGHIGSSLEYGWLKFVRQIP